MVNPVHIEKLVETLRRCGVSRYKDAQMELELVQEMPPPAYEAPEPQEDRGVEEINLAYDHLGFDPEKMFPAKPE